jgi:hypothetical protein
MQLNDEWIRKNIGMITPGTAKFLLERAALQKISLSRDVIFMLDSKVRGEQRRNGPRPLDWAERASGEKND